MLIGIVWSLCNFLFVWLRLDGLVQLADVQQYGVLYMLQENEQAIKETIIYLLFTFVFFYAIISRFYHARKRGKVLAESFFIFVISLIIQAIVLACGYPSAEVLEGDAGMRQVDMRLVLLIAIASISHLALIATITASVWQRKWHANNFGVHMLVGLPSVLALILLSMPVSLVQFSDASWLFYLWFCSMPLTLAVSCATELRPPYLLRLPND